MTVHLEAKPGDIAETVLLPGDPLRAQAIAERLDGAVCFNRVRGMLGFTGTWKGTPVSVQGTGMGMPSASIYAHELITEFGVKRLMRVGTCGGMQPFLSLGDIIVALTASTDSAMNRRRFDGMDFAPCASFTLLEAAVDVARSAGVKVHVGGVFSSDAFYDESEPWKRFARYGVLGAEMETAALYTTAARYGAQALTLLTVSDLIATGEALDAEARQNRCTVMMDLALDAAARVASASAKPPCSFSGNKRHGSVP